MSTHHTNAADADRPVVGEATILFEQRRLWKNGQRISVEELCLAFQSLGVNDDQRLDLIYQEVLLREQRGERPGVEEYLARFPALADELRLQFALDEVIQEKPADRLQVLPDATGSLDGNRVISPTNGLTDYVAPGLPVIDGYQMLHRIGQGGMAVVFKARHLKLNRLVANKMLRDHYGATSTHVRRFLTEAHVAARLQHPHIVQIYDIGQHDGRPFLAYEFLDGGTLSEYFKGQAQEPRLAAALCETLAKTLHYAHQHGVVHRDFKLANILLHRIADDGTPSLGNSAARLANDREKLLGDLKGRQIKVADFGLAKILENQDGSEVNSQTGTGDILGTPAYMSPEQARGDASLISAATDIYALGATLYELLTGRPPFVGTQPLAVLSQVIENDPILPSQLVPRMPMDIQTICLKCLEKSPAKRYASASDVADDLGRFLAGEPIIARQVSPIGRSWRWCRRNPVKSVVGASLITLLILISAMSSVYSVLLRKQLDLVSIAKQDEQAARVRAFQQLWDARLSRAEAQWASRRVGQRYAALEAIEAARDLGTSIDFSPDQINRLRNASIACLSHPDLRIVSQWPIDPRQQSIGRVTMDAGKSAFAFRSEQNEIVVSRIGDGFELMRLAGCTSESVPLLSPDGKLLAVVDEKCRLFRLNEPTPLFSFESSGAGAWSFSPDSRKMVGTDQDGRLLIVDLQDPRSVKSVEIHTNAREIAISPDSRKVAIITTDSAQIIELDTGRPLFPIDPPDQQVGECRLAWHPDSTRIAIGCYLGEGVVLWDVNQGTKLRSFPHCSGHLTVCFGSMGDLLLTYDHWSKRFVLWNPDNGDIELSETNIALSAIRPDATGGFCALRMLESGCIAAISIDHPQICQSLAMTPEPQVNGMTTDLAYNSDGRLLAVAASGNVQIFDAAGLKTLGQLAMGSGYVRFEADDSLLTFNRLGLNRWAASVSSMQDRSDDGTETSTVTFGRCESINNAYYSACFDVDNVHRIVAVSTGNNAIVWRKDLPVSKKSIGPHRDIRSVSISADGRQLVTGGWNGGKACVWDLDSGDLVHTIDEPDCCLVRFSPDGNWLVTNAKDVKVRQTGSWRVETTLDVPGQSASGVKVSFSADSRLLAVSDSEARIHLFDTSDWREIAALAIPSERNAFHLAFSPTGNQLAVILAPFDNRVVVWLMDAIGSELQERQLGWSIARGKEPSQIVNSNRIGRVQFTTDARFEELSAAEQVQLAQRAAEKSDILSARAAIRHAIELQPQDGSTCNNLARLLATGPLTLRDPERAVELGRRAMDDQSLTIAQRAHYRNTLGVSFYRANQTEEAMEMLNQNLAVQPLEQQPFDLFFLSMCYSRRGDQVTALHVFNQAEVLVLEYKPRMPGKWRAELAQFAEEARSLLTPRSAE